MSRKHPKRRRMREHFAMLPDQVFTSEACRTLPHSALRVLLALCAQYRGRNNGDLALTWATCRPYGINSKWQLADALAMLLERGLIQKTRQGGKKPLGPCLYSLTWLPIDECGGKLEVSMSMTPSHAWSEWKENTAPQINHRHPRRGGSAPPAGHRTPISAPPEVLEEAIIGTPGGTPSRSRPGSSEARASGAARPGGNGAASAGDGPAEAA
jgi:hypothetical protein